MSEPTISTIELHGAKVRVMRAGAGAPLVLLHGAAGADRWLPVMDKLAKQFDVIVPEHPGYGGSEIPDWLDTVADLAVFYIDFLAALDLAKAHLVGFSLGGWIAAELAIRTTQRLASLTLVDAPGIRVAGVEQVDPFATNEQQSIRDLFHDQALAEQMIANVLTPETEDTRLRNQLATAKLSWQPRFYDPHLEKWLGRIDVPTLIVWGANDRLFPKEFAHAWQMRIPGARLAVIEACGHLPQVEQKDAFVSALQDFISEERVVA